MQATFLQRRDLFLTKRYEMLRAVHTKCGAERRAHARIRAQCEHRYCFQRVRLR